MQRASRSTKIGGRGRAFGAPAALRSLDEPTSRFLRSIVQRYTMPDTRTLAADSAIDRIFGPVIQVQTWINTLYLLISFPLGVVYFVALVTIDRKSTRLNSSHLVI